MDLNATIDLILASTSPRRKELLQEVGMPFTVQAPHTHEQRQPDETPADYALRNALEKGLAVSTPELQSWVLSADTIVVSAKNEVLEKPKDVDDARRMLQTLSGRTHTVFTAYAFTRRGRTACSQVVATKVRFRNVDLSEIERYIATKDPFDKSGSYGIQGPAMGFIEHIEGSYTNVMGLPLSHVLQDLERLCTYEAVAQQAQTPQIHPKTNRPINKPHWLKSGLTGGETLFQIKDQLRQKKLHTVCEEAKCPNIASCWNVGTATFMILGDTCTRGCRFCHIKTGNPGGLLDPLEPDFVAQSVRNMDLQYAVITMVDRDDLPDGGAAHIAQTIHAIQQQNPATRVEILSGDFQGNRDSLQAVLYAGRGLDVFAHNVETVERLSPRVRDPRAQYRQSLQVLKSAKELKPGGIYTKSAIMLGLGETGEEVYQTLRDLRAVDVDIITIGQYLQPTPKHLVVKRYAHPSEFDFWAKVSKDLGFLGVASGPLVRSSYKASHLFPAGMESPGQARVVS